eukprot:scaffold76493_cov21-Prasinocladus_malaysianus.AAC.1
MSRAEAHMPCNWLPRTDDGDILVLCHGSGTARQSMYSRAGGAVLDFAVFAHSAFGCDSFVPSERARWERKGTLRFITRAGKAGGGVMWPKRMSHECSQGCCSAGWAA